MMNSMLMLTFWANLVQKNQDCQSRQALPRKNFFSSDFFRQKSIILYFSFTYFFNKIVKPKCKIPFSKLLYISYLICTSNVRPSKFRGIQNYIP